MAFRAAGEEVSTRRRSGEEVLERTGFLFTVFKHRVVHLALESDQAPGGVRDGVRDVDGRDLAAESEGVLAHQIRDVVLVIEIMVGPVVRTVMPTAQFLKTRKVDIWQPPSLRHARVDGE